MKLARCAVVRSCQSYKPYKLTTASTDVSASSARSACQAGSLAVSPRSVARCPPAEEPAATMKSGSPPNWATFARAQATAALTSVI